MGYVSWATVAEVSEHIGRARKFTCTKCAQRAHSPLLRVVKALLRVA